MKGIYVIVAFLASWIVIIADVSSHQDRFILRKKDYCSDKDEIPTKCPLRDINDTVVHLAHETDCTKFYICSWGETHEKICPFYNEEKTKRLHFNRRCQYCDWPPIAGCIDCPGNEKDGYPRVKISHESDNCSHYYECIDGKKLLHSCAEDLCFSRTCQACVRDRANGNCS